MDEETIKPGGTVRAVTLEQLQAEARERLLANVRRGGEYAERTLEGVLGQATDYVRRAERAETALRLAQATIRAAGPDAAGHRQPIDPPAGHWWMTGTAGQLAGRLLCSTCSLTRPDVQGITAAECLERSR